MLRLSVIIPVLNEASRIADAVRHAWDLRPYEVIVVDGGSTDGTTKIAARQRCMLLRSARGRAIQQNTGARHAVGDVLLFIHADTWLAADAAGQIAKAIGKYALVAGAFLQRIEHSASIYRLIERGNALRARVLGMPYGDQALFIRSDVFRQLGGFPNVALMEDVLLMQQLRRRSLPVLLPGPLHVSARRWEEYGVVRQTLRNWLLLIALELGAPPERLAEFYRPHASGR